MTDLEKHVNQPGRAKLIKNVREKIKLITKVHPADLDVLHEILFLFLIDFVKMFT